MSQKLTLINDHGPLYRVQLIDSLPLGDGGFSQAMPSSEDLRQVQQLNQRVVAGYEVLLKHFQVYHAVIEYLDNPSVLLDLPQPHRMELSKLQHGGGA